jgi:NADPH2:quinone reductase
MYIEGKGIILVGDPPFILGYEGAGVIEYVGEDVHHVKTGDRVGFADVPHANAELVSVPADKLLPLQAESVNY